MSWFGDLSRIEGRIVEKDESWVRAQPDVATAWARADTPSRLCWVAALGTRSDAMVLGWLQDQADALEALGEEAAPPNAALLAAVAADCRAMLDQPGSCLEADGEGGRVHLAPLDKALEALAREEAALAAGLAPLRRAADEPRLERLLEHVGALAAAVEAAGTSSDEFAGAMASAAESLADPGDLRILAEGQVLRAVVALHAERHRLLAARALARSLDVATQAVGMRLLLTRLDHLVAVGDERATELLAQSGLEPSAVEQIHSLTFEHYHETLDEIVLARALGELASDDARWGDALLTRASRLALFGLKVLADGEHDPRGEDDLTYLVGVELVPLRQEHRRALLEELRADRDLPADDDARVEEWDAIKRDLLAEALAER